MPDSASTWWADSTAPSARCGSSWLSSRSRPSSRENVRRHATDGSLAPASISAIAASNARRCGVPGASTVAASSPSARNGSRVNFEARSMSLDDGSVAGVATGVVSAMKGVDSVKTAVYSARSRALRGSLGSEGPALPAKAGRPCEATSITAGPARSASLRVQCAVCSTFSPPSRSSPSWSSGSARRVATRPRRRPQTFDLEQAQQQLAGAPAPLAALYEQPNAILDGRLRAARQGARGPPDRHQQVGLVVPAVPRRVPDLPAGRDRARQGGRLPRRQRRRQAPGGGEVPRRAPAAVPVLRGSRRGHRPRARGGQVLPDDDLRRRQGRHRVREGRRVHVAAELEADIDKYLG